VKEDGSSGRSIVNAEVSELIALAKETVVHVDSALRRAALTRILDDLLRRRADDRIAAAIQNAPTSEVSQLLRLCVEDAVEHVAVASNGLDVTSHLFCAAAIVTLAEPLNETEFDAVLTQPPKNSDRRITERDGPSEFGIVFVIPHLLTYEAITSMGYSGLRALAISMAQRYGNTHVGASGFAPDTRAAPRRTMTFVRYVVASRVTADNMAQFPRIGCLALSDSLQTMLARFGDSIEFVHYQCNGSLFDTVRKGFWIYQQARLRDIALRIREELGSTKGIAATLSAHGPPYCYEVRIGFFKSNRLLMHHCYSIRGLPNQTSQRCMQDISARLFDGGIRDVFTFDHSIDDDRTRESMLTDPGGHKILSRLLIPL
jgi:hypothetical protein